MINIHYWAFEQLADLRGAKLNAFVAGAKARFNQRAIQAIYSQPHLRRLEEEGYVAADAYVTAGGESVCCCDCCNAYPAFRSALT